MDLQNRSSVAGPDGEFFEALAELEAGRLGIVVLAYRVYR